MQADSYQYIAPNSTTLPRYIAVRAAEAACVSSLSDVLSDHDKTRATPETFAFVSQAVRAFSAVCAAVAPRSADLAAAERCIRLARMLMNEALGAPQRDRSSHIFSLALDELTKARMQACAAIALADLNELPAWEG